MTSTPTFSDQGGQDFTVTHRTVLSLAIPATLAYISTPLVGLADTWAIGQVGEASLIGAVAVGSILFDILFATMNFLRTGTTGLVAQAFGAGQQREETAILGRALLVSVAIGVAFWLLQTPLLQAGLWFIGGSDRVQEAVAIYFAVRIFAAPLTLSNFAILGYFLGRGEGVTGLVLQTVLNLTNIILNIWFVMGLGWGVEGVAAATVIAQLVALIVGAVLVWRRLNKVALPTWSEIADRTALARMMAVNRDIMIRSFALLFAFATFTRLSAQQGEVVLAANAILEKFFLLSGYFLDGIAVASEQLVGRALGAKRRKPMVDTVRLGIIWSAILTLAAFVFFMALGEAIINAMTPAQEVRDAAIAFLIFAALTPVAGAAAFLMDGVYIGATWSREMRNMMLLSLAIFLVTAYTFLPIFGNTGLWVSLLLFLGLRGVSLGLLLPRKINQAFAN